VTTKQSFLACYWMVDTTPSLQGLGMGQSTKVTIQISACFKRVNCFENHRTANSTPFSQKLLPCLVSTGKHSFYAQQLSPKCSKLHLVHQGFANAHQKCSIQIQTHIRAEDVHHWEDVYIVSCWTNQCSEEMLQCKYNHTSEQRMYTSQRMCVCTVRCWTMWNHSQE